MEGTHRLEGGPPDKIRMLSVGQVPGIESSLTKILESCPKMPLHLSHQSITTSFTVRLTVQTLALSWPLTLLGDLKNYIIPRLARPPDRQPRHP